jgi:hypothetical protein
MVDRQIFSWERRTTCKEYITPESIVGAAKGLSLQFTGRDSDLLESLSERDVIVDVADITYGMKDKNPVDFVRFYSKHDPLRECMPSDCAANRPISPHHRMCQGRKE